MVRKENAALEGKSVEAGLSFGKLWVKPLKLPGHA
jgi:hypothetical protein